ncbi:MAG: addiction module protein [Saprospiraceae bacterium]|nr:addiction module protein [Pyrinomonadaceae bacterium]
MRVQTIPTIEEMTPSQRVELMEELWKAMSRRPEEIESPDWHRDVLKERERALAKGEIGFIDWEDAKAEIRRRTIDRAK